MPTPNEATAFNPEVLKKIKALPDPGVRILEILDMMIKNSGMEASRADTE